MRIGDRGSGRWGTHLLDNSTRSPEDMRIGVFDRTNAPLEHQALDEAWPGSDCVERLWQPKVQALLTEAPYRRRMTAPKNPLRYFDSSPKVIRLVVMMYVKHPLSLRNVEERLFERGIDVRLRGAFPPKSTSVASACRSVSRRPAFDRRSRTHRRCATASPPPMEEETSGYAGWTRD